MSDKHRKHQQACIYLIARDIGTISPWASKATDIARNCGLDNIERIERGYGGVD